MKVALAIIVHSAPRRSRLSVTSGLSVVDSGSAKNALHSTRLCGTLGPSVMFFDNRVSATHWKSDGLRKSLKAKGWLK